MSIKNWDDFTSEGYKLTEAEMNKLAKDMMKEYDNAYKDISAQLQKVYKKYLSTTDPADYYNVMIEFDRLNKLQRQIEAAYTGYSLKAGYLLQESQKLANSNNFYRQQYTFTWLADDLPVKLSYSIMNPWLMEWSVYGTEDVWTEISKSAREKIQKTWGSLRAYTPKNGTLTDLLVNNRQLELQKIRQILSSGFQRGESYTKIAKDIKKVIGSQATVDGVTHYSGAKASAMNIVRTEGTRNLNAGNYSAEKWASNQGVDIIRFWISTLDTNTRSEHQGLDGQERGIDEPFTAPDGEEAMWPGGFSSAAQNVNCRCSVGEKVSGIEPSVRRGKNPSTGKYEIFEYKSFPEWAKDHGMKQNKYGRWVE